MEIVAISPRGYCHGVVNALSMVKTAIKENPDKQIYVMGIIIHNKFVKKALDNLDVITLFDENKSRMELLDQVDRGVIIFSAHGTDEKVIRAAKTKGLIVYNAVCKDVTKTVNIAQEYISEGYEILYIGKANHPEALAMISTNPDKIKLITSVTDLNSLVITDKTIVTNQTTMSIYDTKNIVEQILNLNPNVKIINEICRATQMRQEALLNLEDFDLVYVVGDKLSNNSNNLAKIAKLSTSKVQLIESVLDINPHDLISIKKVGVTSGASTPTSITNQVIDYLKAYPNVNNGDLKIDYSKIL